MNSICFTITCAIGVRLARPIEVNCSGVGVRSAEKSSSTRIYIVIPSDYPGVQEGDPVQSGIFLRNLVKRIRAWRTSGLSK